MVLNMNEEDFFSSITIKDDEIEKARHYIKYRGLHEHVYVRDYLESVIGNKPTYAQIATAMRYDKSIRRIIYKYIGLLEEFLRAYVCNKYENDVNLLPKTEALLNVLESNCLYHAIIGLTFNKLISEVKLLPDEDKEDLFDCYVGKKDFFNRDMQAIVDLRNEVSHNRFLLCNMGLSISSAGDNNGSLWSNIKNLHNYLPEFARDKFVKDITDCSLSRDIKYDSQVEWDLVEAIIITF